MKENFWTNLTEKSDNHSEKVRHIIEQKPAFIVRWGNTLLLIIILFTILIIAINYF